ncbi:hypothetical protein [Bifidobacterium sp. SO1]|uniref:hypothetical protein n=1 Tax=Bifidobacterium sp. SO1 TaxID=2809029 RepID=UPI001BDCDBD4|nr:hypothetical protein [Bifidobacterium sp. SO1]MBT1162230.1 hypothetical protein [Bifidobacterium sp. SO1]
MSTRNITRIARTSGKCSRTGKIRYNNLFEAKLALATCKGSASRKRSERRTYLCEFCHNWHLTSQNGHYKNIPDRQYERCYKLMNSDNVIKSTALSSFRKLQAKERKTEEWEPIIIAAIHAYTSAGLPVEELRNLWLWNAFRTRIDVNDLTMKRCLREFTALCERFVKEREADPFSWTDVDAVRQLAACYSEKNQAEDTAVRAWIIRAVEMG